ncbi:MAG TPA: hypothetical protein PLV68_21160, partial [Ilumatobacteraceae bacterium]|nr:hypothetical protein [Ilumatobacteraceae bacterium]
MGRAVELAAFDAILSRADPRNVVHLIGPGGIGKSTLLREVARRAAALGYVVRVLEGRDLPPFPDEIGEALEVGDLGGRPLLMIIDSYELLGSLDGHLRNSVVPSLPDSSVVVLAGRTRPSPGWFDGGWDTVSATVELTGISNAEALTLVRHHGLDDLQVAEGLVHRSGGSPLALVIGAQSGGNGSMAELLDRLLGEEDDPERGRVLGVAALARVTTPELLEAVLPGNDPHSEYKWLADRSYVEPLADGVALHALVARAL